MFSSIFPFNKFVAPFFLSSLSGTPLIDVSVLDVALEESYPYLKLSSLFVCLFFFLFNLNGFSTSPSFS